MRSKLVSNGYSREENIEYKIHSTINCIEIVVLFVCIKQSTVNIWKAISKLKYFIVN